MSNLNEYELNDAESLFFKADQTINDGDIPKAQKMLLELADKYPSFGKTYNHLGWIYSKHYRDFERAEENYKKCIEYSPKYPAIYLNYSYLLSDAGRYEELENLLNKALTVSGINKASIYNEFGIMYELQSKFSQSIEAYKNAYLNTFDSKSTDTYKESIKRVKEKMEFLNSI